MKKGDINRIFSLLGYNNLCGAWGIVMNNALENVRFNFLYIDTYSFGRNWVFPESKVPYNMFRYIESGTGTFFIDDEEFHVFQNDIVYIPRGSRLSCYAGTDNFKFTSIRFTRSVFFEGGDFLSDYYNFPKVFEGREEKKYFDEMYGWIKKEDSARMFFVRGNLELLIGSLIAKVNMNQDLQNNNFALEGYDAEKISKRIRKSGRKIDTRIQGVVDYILLHPTEKYSPKKMADMAGLSRQRFAFLFKQQLGKPPMVYVRELKLTTAARRLLVSGVNVCDIAYELGYEDPNYFIREFKKNYGYTPNQYRQIARE